MGIPTVSTSIGAEGIEFTPGQDLLLGDDPSSIAALILDLLKNPARGKALANRALDVARSRYDWSVVIERLLEDYARLASPRDAEISPPRT
jgi:glycosyltransferase involved in cell wall biosynthesis